MARIHTEQTFETAIEQALLRNGYQLGDPSTFDPQLGLSPRELFAFLQASQPEKWQKLGQIHGLPLEQKLLTRLAREIELRGKLDVLRNGFTDYGVKFTVCYFRPETRLNPETEALYDQNILTVTRQVRYDPKHPEKSLDVLLSVNGLPLVTIELKNQLSGQNVDHAKRQFRYDRDFHTPLFRFKQGALIHFAVDADNAYMTTRLQGKDTRYLPFNLGFNNGQGNPTTDGYRTSYLWEDIWTKDSLLDIFGKFVHLATKEVEIDGQTRKKETIFFPRFHQLRVVRKVRDHVYAYGAGHNYLIQHSAGSGKSMSIAWLAYRLSSLHNASDERIFHSVIVITDRRVLDKQLQDTIYDIDHKQGVVQKIDQNSQQLAEALEAGSSIIITTLQKFPFVLEHIGELPNRRYAVIVDEAHSSQGGEASKKLKEVLSAANLEEAAAAEAEEADADDGLDDVRQSMLARGGQDNLSFFAFTATPKAKTLQVFGTPGPDGKPRPFDLYSMRQAIEEGFIHDVLENYVTYKTFFRLSKAIEDDPEVNKKKAARAIGRFLSLHPHNIAQKTEIMVEHFRQVTRHKIGGSAKAMVVTGSRLHAVRYKLEFDRYIKAKGYHQGENPIRTLVAFSGKVIDEGMEYTEPQMNGFGLNELRRKFDTEEYQVLLVADKYQTGFDQPLLHTMYVDKKLSGVKAVQTLSRLNRTAPGKEDTFILDFVNEREIILQAFQPYYEVTTIDEPTDPNHLYDLRTNIEQYQVIWTTEMEAFAKVYFRNARTVQAKDQAKLNAALDPAVDRFKALAQMEQDDFKQAAVSFVRLYNFLSQIMPFHDVELEMLFIYLRFLLKKLPRQSLSERYQLTDEVALEYYRLQKVEEGRIELEKGQEGELSGAKEAGLRGPDESKAHLSEIIDILNDRLGTDFTPADKLFFDQIEAEMMQDEELAQQARSNDDITNFRFGFNDKFMDAVIDRMDLNQAIFTRLLDDDQFAQLVKELLVEKVYRGLREGK